MRRNTGGGTVGVRHLDLHRAKQKFLRILVTFALLHCTINYTYIYRKSLAVELDERAGNEMRKLIDGFPGMPGVCTYFICLSNSTTRIPKVSQKPRINQTMPVILR